MVVEVLQHQIVRMSLRVGHQPGIHLLLWDLAFVDVLVVEEEGADQTHFQFRRLSPVEEALPVAEEGFTILLPR